MPENISINNFSDGMIPDIDKSVKSKNSYDLAENLRYLANRYSNTGTLHSVESSSSLDTSTLSSDDYIIGDCKIRDYLVLFVTRWINSSTRSDRIIRFTIDNNSLTSPITLWTGNNLYSDVAGASASELPEYLSTVGRYEDEDNIKVYWANSTKPIRVANVSTTFLTYIQERFDLITPFDMVSPSFENMVSGSLESGRVDYAYSLLKENGQESIISGTLDASKINLFFDNVDSSSTVNIKGDSEVVDTGKGVKLSVNVSSNDFSYFDKIRLYRIHYKEFSQLPQIVIVGDFDIISSGSNTILDTGTSSLGEFTSEEFSVISSVAYSAYTIEEKDNYLFAGNVKEERFDIDFDSRAYRFNGSGDSRIYTDYGSYSSPQYVVTSGNWGSVSSTANCINPGNDLDNDISISGTDDTSVAVPNVMTDSTQSWTTNEFIGYTLYNITDGTKGTITSNTPTTVTASGSGTWDSGDVYIIRMEYIYQSDGTTVGGEGPEVSYSFSSVVGAVELDTSSTYTEERTYSGDPDYSDPSVVHTYTVYQRDEIYRFGLVFYDDNGNRSPVKWIGDIRFPGPEYSNSAFYNLVNSSNVYTTEINFSLKSGLPSGASAWEIVRAIRTESDRSILATGYMSSTIDADLVTYSGTDFTCKPKAPFVDSTPPYSIGGPGTNNTSINNRILTFVSPEISFYENLNIKSGDYIDVVGKISNSIADTESGVAYPSASSNVYNVIKYRSNTFRDHTDTVDRYILDFSEYTAGIIPVRTFNFTQSVGQGLKNTCLLNLSVSTKTSSPTGRTVYLQLSSNFDPTGFTNYELPYTYIKRNNTERYGGASYQSRLNTNYISSSQSDTSSSITARKGDTYINYFNYMDYMFSSDHNEEFWGVFNIANLASAFVTFPVESKINLSLRYDDHFAKVYGSPTSFLLKETAGLHSDATFEYEQDTDLYLYNSIYSQEQNIDYDFPEIEEFRTDFDSRVVHSDKKFDDEYIDSWTKFRVNNFLDLESKHGSITSLKKYNNVLYFLQTDAFGALSVNQRSLLSDNNPGTLSLGTGGTLERFDYITEYYGCKHKKSIGSNKSGIYYYDKLKKSIIQYTGNKLDILNDSKGLNSLLYSITENDIPFIVGNDKNNEIYFTLDQNDTLVFNTFTNNFISNYTFSPNYISDANNFTYYKILSDNYLYGLYLNVNTHNSFDSGTTYNDSKLIITNNDNFLNTKTYDNLVFYTTSKYSGVERNTDNFNSVSFYNDYQYTGSINLILGTNLEKRERGYSLVIPRNIVNVNGSTNIDIFNPTYHNSSREFKERMRDKYITAELVYESAVNKGQISVPFIGFKYRNSIR